MIPTITIQDNKLLFSSTAVEKLKVVSGDRIAINYIQKSSELTIPIVGKSDKFADKESGNKLTKSNTVSYRGRQREVLMEYGSVFELIEYKPEIFILRKINN